MWDKQRACKHHFVWRNSSLFDLASDSELTLALMIIIRLTCYSLSPCKPTITSLAHCVRTKSVWGTSHWIIPGYLLQPLLTNTLNIQIPEKEKKLWWLWTHNKHEPTCTDMHPRTCAYWMYELAKHVQWTQCSFAANFHTQKCIVKMKTLLLTYLSLAAVTKKQRITDAALH